MNATFTNVKSNKFILIFAILQIFLSYTAENFSASKVALEMRSLRSGLNLAMSFTKPNKTSVWSVLSWASSMIITLKIWKRKIWIYVGSEYNLYLHEVLAELWLLYNICHYKKCTGILISMYRWPVTSQIWFSQEFTQQHSVCHVFDHGSLRCTVFKSDTVANLW